MAKFVVVYKGGQMGATPEEQEAVMQEWGAFFGALGSSVTDMGNPFGGSAQLASNGSRAEATTGLSGYSTIEASDLDAALQAVKGCPVFKSGGSLELFEAIPM